MKEQAIDGDGGEQAPSPALHHAKNYQYPSDILDDAFETTEPWDAYSVRLLARKMAHWIEGLEVSNSLLKRGINCSSKPMRRPPGKPPKNRVGIIPFVDGLGCNQPNCQVVYFVQGVGTNLVKIGWTKELGVRMAGLATNSPVPLRLLSWQRALGRNCEQALHAQFDEYREYGEWFRLEGRLVEYINAMPAARRRAKSRRSDGVVQ